MSVMNGTPIPVGSPHADMVYLRQCHGEEDVQKASKTWNCLNTKISAQSTQEQILACEIATSSVRCILEFLLKKVEPRKRGVG